MTNATLFINEGQLLLNVGVGAVLPALVALVAHKLASGPVKTLLLVALSAAGSVLTTVSVADLHWRDLLAAFSTELAAGIVAHYGVLRPLGVTGPTGVIAKALPGGVGKPAAPAAAVTLADNTGVAP